MFFSQLNHHMHIVFLRSFEVFVIVIDILYFWLSFLSILIRLNYEDNMIWGDPDNFFEVGQQTIFPPRQRTRNICCLLTNQKVVKMQERSLRDSSFQKSLESKKRCCGDGGHFPPGIDHLCNLLVARSDR